MTAAATILSLSKLGGYRIEGRVLASISSLVFRRYCALFLTHPLYSPESLPPLKAPAHPGSVVRDCNRRRNVCETIRSADNVPGLTTTYSISFEAIDFMTD